MDCSQDGKIKLQNKVAISHFAQLQARGGSIQMDEGSEINNFSLIYTGGSDVIIGKNVLIGPRVNIIGYQHSFNIIDKPIKHQPYIKDNITIKDDVWIGSSSVIMAGVTIGEGAIIGAGSIVTKDVEPYSINVGNPSKQIRKREGFE